MIKKKYLFSFFILSLWHITSVFAQQLQAKIDSLENILLNDVNTSKQKIDILNELGKMYLDLDQIKLYADKALQLSANLNYQKGMGYALFNLARYQHHKGENAEAVKTFLKAKKIFTLIREEEGLVLVYAGLGIQYNAFGNRKKALECLFRVLRIDEETNNLDHTTITLNNIGSVYFHTADYENAHRYYTKALNYSKKHNIFTLRETIYNNLGQVQAERKKWDNALKYYFHSVKISKEIRDHYAYSYTLSNIGKAYAEKKEYTKAFRYMKKALQVAKKIKSHRVLILIYYNYSEAYLRLKQYDKAERYFKKGLKTLEQTQTKEYKLKIYAGLSKLYSLKGLFKKAYNYQKQYQGLADSVFNDKQSKHIVQMQTLYETEKKENENENLRETQAKHKAIIQFQIWTNMLTGIAVFMLMLVLFLLYRAFYQKQRHNKTLFEKNKEIYKKNQALSEANLVKDKLFSIISHDLRAPINYIIPTFTLIRQNLLNPEERENVMGRLEIQLRNTSQLLDNLLYWAKSQMQGISCIKEPLCVKTVLTQIVPLFEPTIRQKGVSLEAVVSEDIWVEADENMLELVFRNLLHNASKYTGKGDCIQIFILHNISKEEVCIQIKDSGVGMSEEIQKKLFVSRIESSRGTMQEKGTGLGLLLIKDFVEKQGGKIWVESKEGEGTSFFFTLRRISSERLVQNHSDNSST